MWTNMGLASRSFLCFRGAVGMWRPLAAIKTAALPCALALCAGAALPATAAAEFTFVSKWGGRGAANGQFNGISGIATDRSGNVYVGDNNNGRVQVFTNDGVWLRSMGQYGTNRTVPGQFNGVGGVAVDSEGNVFAVDVGNYRVQKFAPDGTPLTYFGAEDVPNRPGEQTFDSNPRAVAIDAAGDVYVVDRYHVHKFDNNGARLGQWGLAAGAGTGPGEFDNPRGIAAGPDGSIWVADTGNARVQRFSTSGEFRGEFGGRGSEPGQFLQPIGIAPGPNGNLYVGDDFRRDVQVFNSGLAFVAAHASAPGANPDTFRPFHLAVDGQQNVFITDSQVNVGERVLKVHDRSDTPPLPPPVPGKTMNVKPERGRVLIKYPRGTAPPRSKALQPAGSGFVRLAEAAQIPIGATVDVTRGQIGMTSAGPGGRIDTGSFYSGQFSVLQPRAGRFTDLVMNQPLRCARARRGKLAPAARRVRSRRLWGRGRGRFRTRGRYSTATVRGTVWLTKDSCTSTTTAVREGRVVVRDRAKRRNITVRAGQRYVARAKKRR